MNDLRQLLRRHAAGVVVVATLDGQGGPVGLTVSSFTPVSLDPPLISFCVGLDASTRPAVQRAAGFAVTVLGGEQAALAARFASRGLDRFADTGWYPGPGGWPCLPGALSWLACDTELTQPAGDHLLVIGRVIHAQAGPADHPLVHHGGELYGLPARRPRIRPAAA